MYNDSVLWILINAYSISQHSLGKQYGLTIFSLFRSAVENKLRYLTSLYAGTIGTFGRTLKLKRHATNGHLTHTLLTEITQFGSV
jgi:hypothetical protein